MVGPSQQKGKTILWNFCQIGFQRFPNQSNAQISCKKKKNASVVQLLIADAFKDDLARSGANLSEVDFGKPAKK